jgi:phospholipase/carboxylesterase
MPDKPVLVTGTSQDGDLSFALAIRHPAPVRAAFPLLGLSPSRCGPAGPAQGTRMPPPHAFFHGEDDPQGPIATVTATATGLVTSGVPLTPHTYPDTGHDFPPPTRADWRGAVAATLGVAANA